MSFYKPAYVLQTCHTYKKFQLVACNKNNKPEFQLNIKQEFSQTCHKSISLTNTGKLSIFKEYIVQYSSKMEGKSLKSIWHKKDVASIRHHVYNILSDTAKKLYNIQS